MTLSEVLELSLCRLPNFLPYLLLALLPFRDNFRFSLRTTLSLAAVLSLTDCACNVINLVTKQSNLVTLCSVALYITCFLLCIRATASKILFSLFFVLNYAAMVTVVSLFISSIIFGESFSTVHYQSILMPILILLFSFPLMWKYINLQVRPLIISTVPEIQKSWRTLWLVPAVFYFIYYYSFYANWSNSSSIIDFSTKPGNVIFVLLINIGSFLMYRIIQKNLENSAENLRLQEENSCIILFEKQYETLKNNIEETRRARHDLHHHLSVIDYFLYQNDYDGLRGYLKEYRASFPSSKGLPLCDNQVVDAVAGYYYSLAEQSKVETTFFLMLPKKLPLPDNDFCSLFSNILENALEACMRMKKEKPFIRITAKMEGSSMMVLIVENSYEGEILCKGDLFLSSKREGTGVGLASVQSIAKKYNGLVKLEYEKGIFCASVFLSPLPQKLDCSL